MRRFNASIQIKIFTAFLALIVLHSCGLFRSAPKPPRVNTQVIRFKCDSNINQGMLLPVEVIYVTADNNLKEVTAIGPDAWFDSKERESWAHRQTLSLRSGREVRLWLERPPETKYIVIFASFFQINDQEAQQVIIEPDPEKKKAGEEVIWVGASAIYH